MSLTELTIDRVWRLFRLAHILGGAAILGLLHHRLLGIAGASNRCLQSWVDSKPRADFDEVDPLLCVVHPHFLFRNKMRVATVHS